MRRYILTAWAPLLILAAALLAASPASAGPSLTCRPFAAKMETTCPEKTALEVGWVDGIVDGGVWLSYDDTAPPIDPQLSKPNMVISTKAGSIQMWVYSDSIEVKGGWWRVFKVMRTEGTGSFAGAAFSLYAYGYFSTGVGGTYEIDGTLCGVRAQAK